MSKIFAFVYAIVESVLWFTQTGSLRTGKMIQTRLAGLDLEPIKHKLMNPDEGTGEEGWTLDRCDSVENRYKRFLLLTAKGDTTMVPTGDIDKFWHTHILDTAKYAKDCQYVFGFFVHHFPYFGMRGEQDAQDLQSAFVASEAAYAQNFNGEAYKLAPATAGAARCTGRCIRCRSVFDDRYSGERPRPYRG